MILILKFYLELLEINVNNKYMNKTLFHSLNMIVDLNNLELYKAVKHSQ
jgi:hypothetical protein